MNRLSAAQRAQVVGCLVEGMSIRATVRVTGVAKNTIVKLLTDLGKACTEYQDGALANLDCKRIECDEIWSFCYGGAGGDHARPDRRPRCGRCGYRRAATSRGGVMATCVYSVGLYYLSACTDDTDAEATRAVNAAHPNDSSPWSIDVSSPPVGEPNQNDRARRRILFSR